MKHLWFAFVQVPNITCMVVHVWTKWIGEENCRLYTECYDLPTSICRFYNVYGEYQLLEGPLRNCFGYF